MKYEETVFTTEPTRLTERGSQSYAKSMPDHVEVHEAPSVNPSVTEEKQIDHDAVLADMLKNADKAIANVNKHAQEAQTQKNQALTQEKEAASTDTTKDKTAAEPLTQKIEDEDSVPRTSVFSKLFEAFSGTITDDKFINKAKKFDKEAETIHEERLEALKEKYQDWEPNTKNMFIKLVSLTAQNEILQEIARRGVSKADFIKAAELDMSVSPLTPIETDTTTAQSEQIVDRFMTALTKEPAESWTAEVLAETVVDIRDVLTSAPETTVEDVKLVSTLENILFKQASENGVTESIMNDVIQHVAEKREPEPVAEPVEQKQENISTAQPAIHEVQVEDVPTQIDSVALAPESVIPETTEEVAAEPITQEVHSFTPVTEYVAMPTNIAGGNTPEDAELLWEAYARNTGKPLSPDQLSLAKHGYAPQIMGGAPTNEETRPQIFPLPPAAEVVSAHRSLDESEREEGTDQIRELRTPRGFEPTVMEANRKGKGGGGGGGGGQRQTQQQIEERNKANLNKEINQSLTVADDTKYEIAGMNADDLKRFVEFKFNGTLSDSIISAGYDLPETEKKEINKQKRAAFNQRKAEVDAALAAGNLPDAITRAQSLVDYLIQDRIIARTAEVAKKSENGISEFEVNNNNSPKSMHDVAKLIGETSSEFAKGGEHALIDDKDNFIEENFMYWVQQKFLYFHDQDPDSSQPFFDLIQVENENLFHKISINAMLRNQDLYFKNKDGEKLDDLFKYLTDFVWLVGSIRNANTEYIQQMGSEAKIGDLLANVMKSNVLTKRSASKENTLEAVASLSSNFRDWGNVSRIVSDLNKVLPEGEHLKSKDIMLSEEARQKIIGNDPTVPNYDKFKERYDTVVRETERYNRLIESMKLEEQDMDVGDGVATGYLIYYNMADFNYLNRRFGEEAPQFEKENKKINTKTNLFTQDGMEAVLRKLGGVTDKDDAETIKKKMYDIINRGKLTSSILKDKDKKPIRISDYDSWVNSWYENGVLRKEARKAFMTMFNVFDPPQKNLNQSDIANSLVNLVVGERLAKEKPRDLVGDDKKKALDGVLASSSTKFAQLLASFMTFFTGAAAKNDIAVAATNAAAKPRHIDAYKRKQGESSRAGGFGNLYSLGTIKQSYVDMMTGLLTVSKKSILEIFEEKDTAVSEGQSFTEKEKIARQLLFDANDAKQYGVAGPPNQVKIFQQEIEGKEVDFHKFIHVDPVTGHVAYKPDAMLDALQDAIIKPTRYAWSTNKVPFHKQVRMIVDRKPEDGSPPEFRTGTQLEEMFTEPVLRVIEQTYLTSNKHSTKIPKDILTNGFLDSKGRVIRYKANEKGKLLDADDHVIDTSGKRDDWINKRVVDMSDNGVMDPGMMSAWDDTDFRRCVVKGYLLNRFAAQLYGHTTTHSPYEYMSYGLREDVIRGLMKIPVDPDVHGEAFDGKHITGSYFTKDDIKLLRKLSKNSLWWNGGLRLGNVPLALLRDLRMGLFDGIKEFWSRFVKNVNIS